MRAWKVVCTPLSARFEMVNACGGRPSAREVFVTMASSVTACEAHPPARAAAMRSKGEHRRVREEVMQRAYRDTLRQPIAPSGRCPKVLWAARAAVPTIRPS
ncbi:hypothetical protein VCH24_29710 [Variovorax boronicumulans]|nr:hypothetical protein VCH24_29710 [Variovorax boronicumulans]